MQLTRAEVQRYAAELVAAGKEANTVRLRLAALRQFVRWLVDEDELSDNPLLDLIKAGKGPSLRDKRDEALVRLAVAGRSNRSMIGRYAGAAAADRAAAEARALNLGDL